MKPTTPTLESLSTIHADGSRKFVHPADVHGRFTTWRRVAALVLLVRPIDPWHAMLVWCGGQMFVSPYALWMNGRALGVGPLRPLRAGAAWLVPCSVVVWIAIASGV